MFQLDYASKTPIYEQIYINIVQLTAAGVFKEGDKLPTVRSLAAEMGINPNTVAKAYSLIERDGYIVSTVGKGSFISENFDRLNAEKVLAQMNFEKAVIRAQKFGVSKEQMFGFITDVFEGGTKID